MDCTNIGTFISDNKDYVYSISIKRFIYTPNEWDKKWSDESIYWDSFSGKILQAIEIPNDILLEILRVDDYSNSLNVIEYLKLSDISLSRILDKHDDNYVAIDY